MVIVVLNCIVAINVQASLPSLQWQLLPLLQWRLCLIQASVVIKLSWHCCPCSNGVIAVINAQASLLLSSWGCCPHCDGVAIIDAQASLHSRHLCHCQNILIALAAMALMRSSSWCPHSCHNGIITIVNAQASLPL
jgi:hypothetical protein